MVTVIGLPRNRQRAQKENLAWRVLQRKTADMTNRGTDAIRGKFGEDAMVQRPEYLHDGIYDDNVDVSLISPISRMMDGKLYK